MLYPAAYSVWAAHPHFDKRDKEWRIKSRKSEVAMHQNSARPQRWQRSPPAATDHHHQCAIGGSEWACVPRMDGAWLAAPTRSQEVPALCITSKSQCPQPWGQ